ncbi:MAG: nucleoside hydrolase [Deltaproteobacteria bacterium]|nr:nucleoside hydrolase [Deltaproteobacteria bacterium]
MNVAPPEKHNGRMIVFAEGEFPGLFLAFKKVLELLCSGASCVSSKALPTEPHACRIGLMVFFSEDDFFSYFEQLSANGCRYIVAARPFLTTAMPWEKLQPHASNAFSQKCIVTPMLLPDILQALETQFDKTKIATAQPMSSDSAMAACRARRLYGHIKNFSHGSKNDLTNALLAPACAFCTNDGKDLIIPYDQETVQIIQNTVAVFQREVANNITAADGELGSALKSAWERISNRLDLTDKQMVLKQATREELMHLMGLLTGVRVLAGEKTGSGQATINKNSAPAAERSTPAAASANKNFRVLVLDDHALHWKPFFEKVHNVLQTLGCSIDLEFSTDGQTVLPDGASLWTRLADYDLVLLDIYLKDGSATGLQYLEDIRSRILWLPVIIWTTATEAELPAQASLANGFLFKKKTSIQEVCDIFQKWISQGQSRRTMALPNPFFDHVLQSKEVRECAFAFTHWALKQVDSFHALDETFLRFFNDHGGRHTIQLLNIVEKLLRPFLFLQDTADQNRPAVLSSDPAQREQELLWLYIAVLCHELGMFPMRTADTKAEERFQGMTEDELFYVRKQHCLRSLLLFYDPNKQSPDFHLLVENLRAVSGDQGIAAVAALAGYHGRYLNLKKFCTIDEAAQKKLAEARAKSTYAVADEELRHALNDIRNNFQDGNGERLRRLCAILRLADAIDIDYTRVPADFLLYSDGCPPYQCRENAKRQVVEDVSIDRGRISLVLNAPPPELEEIRTALTPHRKPAAIIKALNDYDFIEAAWHNDKWKAFKISSADKHIKTLQGNIDLWMDRIFFSAPNRHRQSPEQKGLISQLAGLSVIFEIYDEYKAVRDTGLEAIIQLGEIKWGGTRNPSVIYDMPQNDLAEISAENKFFEFKYLLPENAFSKNIFPLICSRQTIAGLKITRQHFQKITDAYYDELNADGTWGCAARGEVVRRRSIQGTEIVQKKTCEKSPEQYNQYKTEGIPAPAASLKNIAVIENDRRTLQLQRRNSLATDEKVFLHLDLFTITIPATGKKIGPLQEIEIVSKDERLIMDVEEELVSAFNLIKVRKSKFAKFQDAICRAAQKGVPPKIWLDMDTGVDDAMALLMALRSDDVCEVVGISAVGGNINVEQCAVNTAKILYHYKKEEALRKIPIYTGAGVHFKADASDVHGENGIGGIDSFLPGFTTPGFKDLFKDFESVQTQDVTFIATGPLTNLARLIKQYPKKMEQLRQIVIMGGVFWESGNRSAAAEFNIHSDPQSAKDVLSFCRKNKIRHVFVPLDATHRVVLKHADVARAPFIKALTETYMDFYDRNQALDGCPLHDPMAVGYALWPELFVTDLFHVEIGGTGANPLDGTTIADCRPTRIFREREKEVTEIVVRVDKKAFLDKVKQKLLS